MTSPAAPWRQRLDDWVHSPAVQNLVMAVILINSVTIGVETAVTHESLAHHVLAVIDRVALAIFVVEIAVKLVAIGPRRFFTRGWNVFDFLVVAVALVPGAGPLSVLRTLRVLRLLRVIKFMPSLRLVVEALLLSLPGISAIAVLMSMVFYVGAVMSTTMFGEAFPDWFGSIGASLYSLFQIMTLESWSMGIVRPVMEVYPWAWAFFVPFILVSAFTMLNLFVAVIVDTMSSVAAEKNAQATTAGQEETGVESQIAAAAQAAEEVVADGWHPGEPMSAQRGPAAETGAGVGAAALARVGADAETGAEAGATDASAAVLAEFRILREEIAALRASLA
ncbi:MULTISPECIES: ion transporter [Actinomyces]|uniref:Ion transporter n=1 Tax=Actinomyces respiraculi TaxID=2744574 RepID=A0A7T0PVC1_9ACTO|nr:MULTISPECIES: ion transporter [Actinomyces]QPL05166.1 ion transporter [Actinomyces respiraculi]